MFVADALGEFDGIFQVHADFADGVCVGAEGDGDAEAVGGVEEGGVRVNLTAVFAQAGGVELDGGACLLRSGEEAFVEGGAVLLRSVAEFLGEIGVADDFEEAARGGHCQSLEINRPHFEGVATIPLGEFGGVVHIPRIGDVMNGADEVIPRMTCGEFADPLFVAGQVIDFEGEFDGELGELALGVADFADVFVELIGAHAPIVEVVARHRGVVGESDLGEAEFDGARGILCRLARGVAAERRVHVIIWRQSHERSVAGKAIQSQSRNGWPRWG